MSSDNNDELVYVKAKLIRTVRGKAMVQTPDGQMIGLSPDHIIKRSELVPAAFSPVEPMMVSPPGKSGNGRKR